MSTQTIKRIHLIYGIVLSVLLAVTGILLMVACVSIYRLGDRPFTTENIANAFGYIQIPIYITIAAVVGGLIFWLCFPAEKQKPKAAVSLKVQTERLERKINLDSCPPTLLMAINSERKLRRLLRWIVAGLCVASSVPALIYVLNFSHFTFENYNGDIIAACMMVLPTFLVGASFGIALVYTEHGSYRREMDLIKIALERFGTAKPAPAQPTEKKPNYVVLGIRIGLAVAAVTLIIAGIVNGGMADVLAKAINICTECIGLG